MSYVGTEFSNGQIMFSAPQDWGFTIKDAGDEGVIDSDVFNSGDDIGKTSQVSMAMLNGTNAGIIEQVAEVLETPTPLSPLPDDLAFLFSP